MEVRHFEQTPLLDGLLPETEWPSGLFQAGFHQLYPNQNEPAFAEVLVAVGQDEAALFIAFHCSIPDGGLPLASVTRRDDGSLPRDDVVGVYLGPHMDRRSGYAIYCNALGTQGDFRIANDMETTDGTWDGQWEVATSAEPGYWIAEIRIPFDSLPFDPEMGEWGANFGRRYPAVLSSVWWNTPLEKEFQPSRAGVLTGLSLPREVRPILLTPYLTARHTEPGTITAEGGWGWDGGADLTATFAGGMNLAATYNPDFASVEADQERINLTPFELSFPEKRLFFLEGNDLWQNRIRTFYTRRIGQIDLGGKLLYQGSGSTVALMGVRESTEAGQGGADWGVVRLRQDVLANSTVGLLGVYRVRGGDYTGVAGSDLFLNLPNDWYVTGQAVASWPDPGFETGAWFLRAERKTEFYDYHLRYTELGERFRDNVNTVGFIQDDNRRELDAAAGYTWYAREGPFRFLEYDSNYNIYWSRISGQLRNWEITQRGEIYFRNDFSLGYDLALEDQEADPPWFDRRYFNNRHKLSLGYRTREWENAEVSFTGGRQYEQDLQLWEFSLNRMLVPKVTLSYSFIDLRMFPDAEDESTWINILRLQYAYSPDLFVRLFAQNNTTSDRLYIYSVFGWRFAPPFSALYITWSEERLSLPGGTEREPMLFFKLSYQFGN